MKRIIQALLLFILTYPVLLYAHDFNDTLGDAATSVDYMMIQCSDDGGGTPTDLYFQLDSSGDAKSPLVSGQVIVGNAIGSVTDPINGDVGMSRALDTPLSGDGNYYVMVDKSKQGSVGYHFTFHCMSNGTHTGTELYTLQNQ